MSKVKRHVTQICVTVGAIILVAIIIIKINEIFYNPYGTGYQIGNLSGINGISRDQINSVQHQLYELLLKNNGMADIEPDASIREETLKINEDGNVKNVSFVVDIDEIRQSYAVSLELRDNKIGGYATGYPAIVTCVYNRDLIIYDDFECLDDFSNSYINELENFTIEKELPLVIKMESGQEFTVTKFYDESEKEILKIDFNNCGDARLMAEAKNTVREWVESLGLDADKYDYLVPTKYDKCLIR